MKSWPLPKDPDDVCDYQFNWEDRLEDGETIATSVFTVDQGTVTIDGTSDPKPPAVDGSLTTFWARGGTAGEVCVVTNRVLTSADRSYDDSARLRIKSTS